MRRQDGFQHEMHHQGPERALIEDIEVDRAHRAPLAYERFGDGALLRRDEVAGEPAGEVVGAGALGEVGRQKRAASGASLADYGDEVLGRAVEIKLKLAMLIDRAKRGDRGDPLALLAQALAPELHIPGGKAGQTIGVGKHHADADAALFGKTDQ